MKSLYIINPPESPGFPLFHTFSIYFVVAVSLSEQIFTGAGRRSLQVDGGAAERHAEGEGSQMATVSGASDGDIIAYPLGKRGKPMVSR